MLRIQIDTNHACGQEAAVAAAAVAAAQPALIVWHHSHIPELARYVAGGQLACPDHWPDDRFDVVWILDRPDSSVSWTFTQVTQRLFANDRHEPI